MILRSKGAIEIVEVGPRDGLQNEKFALDVGTKLDLIRRLALAGLRRIEVASFVNARRVPQMSGAEELCQHLRETRAVERWPEISFIGLVLNERGCERALAAEVDEIGAVCIATDELGIRNQGQTSRESVGIAKQILRMSNSHGRIPNVTIAAAFGCPYEGDVPQQVVVDIAASLAEEQPNEIALADTIGVAAPGQVHELALKVASVISPIPLRLHFHNTSGTGLANVWAGIAAGVKVFDASIGGLGGCPFAAGAAGNISTEDLVYLLEKSSYYTNIDFDKLKTTNAWLVEVIGKDLNSMTVLKDRSKSML